MARMVVGGVEIFYERAGKGERIEMCHSAWTDGRTRHAVTERKIEAGRR